MKLKSHPDTTEVKQRQIGMYKSPAAPSARKRKAVSHSVDKNKARSEELSDNETPKTMVICNLP